MKTNWIEIFSIILKENLSVKDIRIIRNCGQCKAIEIRNNARDYCLENNIEIGNHTVPTIAVFEVTGKGYDYYYNQMIKEKEFKKILTDTM